MNKANLKSKPTLMKVLKSLRLLLQSKSLTQLSLRFRLLIKSDEKAIESVRKKKNKDRSQYNQVLEYLYKKQAADSATKQLVSNGFDAIDLPQFILKDMDDRHMELKTVSSFRNLIALRARAKQLYDGIIPEWNLEDKLKGYEFCDTLDVKRPNTEGAMSLEDIIFEKGTAIKPLDSYGSMGVYLIHDENNIRDVKNKRTLSSFDELVSSLRQDMKSDKIKEDKWLIETIIYRDSEQKSPARDFKFYTFYGEVVLIKEVDRSRNRQLVYWTADGEEVEASIDSVPLLEGEGITKEEVALASRISRAIPAPFVRIDFLKGESGLYFCEFTPRSGTFDKFTQTYDQTMGEAYIRAESRLTNDLMDGKQFKWFFDQKE